VSDGGPACKHCGDPSKWDICDDCWKEYREEYVPVKIREHDAFADEILQPLDEQHTIAEIIAIADEVDEILQALDPVLTPEEYLRQLATLPWESQCDEPMRRMA
jgi:hypothetical protein